MENESKGLQKYHSKGKVLTKIIQVILAFV
jgi:hypothetical protein